VISDRCPLGILTGEEPAVPLHVPIPEPRIRVETGSPVADLHQSGPNQPRRCLDRHRVSGLHRLRWHEVISREQHRPLLLGGFPRNPVEPEVETATLQDLVHIGGPWLDPRFAIDKTSGAESMTIGFYAQPRYPTCRNLQVLSSFTPASSYSPPNGCQWVHHRVTTPGSQDFE